jgi:hypothetical protein
MVVIMITCFPDGMKSSFVHRYKPLIRKYLKELAERGELEELPLEHEPPAEESLLDSSLSREEFLARTRLSFFDLKAMPQKQVQQFDFVREYIAHARAAERSAWILVKQRNEQSPDRGSQSSATEIETWPDHVPATDALVSIVPIHTGHRPDTPSHAQQRTVSMNRDRPLHLTIEDASEGDTRVGNELTEPHEADRRESEVSSVLGAVESGTYEVTKAKQENKSMFNTH